jgi:RNA polymerase sigma-70 factor (ECF subfamily)
MNRRAPEVKPQFETVVTAELDILFRVARLLVRRAEDAEDLVGQTLFLAAKAWDKFDGTYPRSWMIQILRNEHFANLRRKGGRHDVPLDEVCEPSDEGFWEEIEWKLVGDLILDELAELPDEYRMAVALCDVEAMSYEEAAYAMQVPLGTVRSRLYRGRNLLRARLVRHQIGKDNQ